MKVGHIVAVMGMVAVAVTIGCGGPRPVSIGFVQPVLITEKNPVALRAVALDKKGAEIIEVPLGYGISPAGIAEVSDGGYVTCLRSGEATVQIITTGENDGAVATAKVPINCEIVAKIKAPYTWRHVLGRTPPPYDAKPVDAIGKTIKRDVSVTSSAPDVVRVVDGGLEGLTVGSATVVATAAGEVSQTEVTVARLILSEPLSVADGDRRLLTLQQGTYEVEIKVAATDGSSHGVALHWVGASCPNQPAKQSHRVKCVVDTTATLAIENPIRTGQGVPVDGFLNVLQVP